MMSEWVFAFDAVTGLPKRSRVIRSEQELHEYLQEMEERGKGSAQLKHHGCDYLLFGVMDRFAFVHYNPTEKTAAYRWARSNKDNAQEAVTFDIGGTETDIPGKWCISIKEMKAIVRAYYRTGTLPSSTAWDIDE